MRLQSVAIAVFISYGALALGQDNSLQFQPRSSFQLSTSAAKRTLAGTVVNSVTGEPIRRALVHVNGADTRVAFTGSDGRFEIPNVSEGQLFLSAQKPGFFDAALLQTPQMPSGPTSIALNSTTGEITLKLAPEATVHGRLLDKSGEPLESVTVLLLARTIQEGRKEWQHHGQATTDETGAYSISNVRPGSYAIRFVPVSDAAPLTSESSNGVTRSEVLRSAYYPESPDLASLQPFELRPGEDLPVDFTLSTVPSFRVSGVVTGGQDRFSVFCQDVDGQPLARRSHVDFETGKFSIAGVPAGAWIIHAFSQSGQEGSSEAQQAIEVTSSEVTGLVLPLQPLPSIAVQIQNKSAYQNVIVSLTPTAPGGQTRRRFDAIPRPNDPSGALFLRSIPPGSYKVSTRMLGQGCIDSVTSGSTDLLRDELTLSPGSQPAPIAVTLRSDCASISGVVPVSPEQRSGAFVLVLSDSGAQPPQPFRAGPDGKFTVTNLTPGTYRVYAFDNISDLEYADPEALRNFSGQRVTVGANDKTSLQLEDVARTK